MVQVFCTRINDEVSPLLYLKHFSLLPKELQEKNARFKYWKDKVLHLTGKLLLVRALQEFGLGHDSLHDLRYNEYNRPYLPGDIDFNISHSGNYVLCAIGKNIHLGVDIEEIVSPDFTDFEDVMTTDQWVSIKKAADPGKTFFSYWAIKESVIKGDSRGMSIPLTSIIIDNNLAYCNKETWFLKELNIDSKYCAWLATNKTCENIHIQTVPGIIV